MLPRITAALSQFLAPISVAGGNTPDLSGQKGQSQTKEKSAFQRYEQPKEGQQPAEQGAGDGPEPEPHLKLVPDADPTKERTYSDEEEASEKERTKRLRLRNQIGNSSALLQFFRAMSVGREKLGRVFAFGSYQRATKGQKKGSKFRKGAMLDQKAS